MYRKRASRSVLVAFLLAQGMGAGSGLDDLRYPGQVAGLTPCGALQADQSVACNAAAVPLTGG